MSSPPVMARLAKVGVRKRAPSSSTNATTASGWRRPASDSSTRRRGLERADDAQRPVIGAAVGLRVEVRAGAHPRPAVGVVGDRPQRAGAVLADVQADRGRGAREPGARLGLERAPGNRFQPVSVRPIVASSPNQDTNRSRETSGIEDWEDTPMPDATLRIPGFVNAHSHAFQRALRGRVERVDPDHPHDDFWTWREAMYAGRERRRPGRLLRGRAAGSTARWWPPGTRRSASSTTRTTSRAASPTPTATRWPRPASPPRATPASRSCC